MVRIAGHAGKGEILFVVTGNESVAENRKQKSVKGG